MRALALTLSILLSIAPWSGAMAYAVFDDGQAAATVSEPADHAMPCHTEQAQAKPICDNCVQNDCDSGDCQQCANTAAGILPTIGLAAPLREHEAFVECQANSHSLDTTPESPPPIARLTTQ